MGGSISNPACAATFAFVGDPYPDGVTFYSNDAASDLTFTMSYSADVCAPEYDIPFLSGVTPDPTQNSFDVYLQPAGTGDSYTCASGVYIPETPTTGTQELTITCTGLPDDTIVGGEYYFQLDSYDDYDIFIPPFITNFATEADTNSATFTIDAIVASSVPRRRAAAREQKRREQVLGGQNVVSTLSAFGAVGLCPGGKVACPMQGGLAGKDEWTCIDILNTLDTCGGCPGSVRQKDCTQIPHADAVQCVMGSCQVSACDSDYWMVSSNMTTCEPVTL